MAATQAHSRVHVTHAHPPPNSTRRSLRTWTPPPQPPALRLPGPEAAAPASAAPSRPSQGRTLLSQSREPPPPHSSPTPPPAPAGRRSGGPWEERSAKNRTWVPRAGPTPYRRGLHQEPGAGDRAPGMDAVRRQKRGRTQTAGHPRRCDPSSLVDAASQTPPPLPCRLGAGVKAFVLLLLARVPAPPIPTWAPGDSLRGPAGGPAGSCCAPCPAPPRPTASLGPRSPSSARGRRGSGQRWLPRPPPRPASAHWSERTAPPAPPNRSPGLPPPPGLKDGGGRCGRALPPLRRGRPRHAPGVLGSPKSLPAAAWAFLLGLQGTVLPRQTLCAPIPACRSQSAPPSRARRGFNSILLLPGNLLHDLPTSSMG
nr:uncharacterized protein LOC129528143 [Gorilla gorilla gorilla]